MYLKLKKRISQISLISVLGIFLVSGIGLFAETATEDSTQTQTDKQKDQSKKEKKKKDVKVLHYEMTVTATREKKDTFNVPKPVSVVGKKKIKEKSPNNATELLTELPGVDINGVGTNQSRPVIRGFRGQRILLLEDGIRMNNSRRQQDFGELPALVDINSVDRIEVVRGPASVLYGSDAIGGVVNIITTIPEGSMQRKGLYGNLGYRYSSADKQNREFLSLGGNYDKFSFSLSGNYRKSDEYEAPAGSFGNITLDEDSTVSDTGVEDYGFNLQLDYRTSKNSHVKFKYEMYHAENAGFGFVDPDLYDPGAARIRIQYPMQKVNKFSLKYEHRKMDFLLADHFSLTGYRTNNRRDLSMDIFASFGIPHMPQAGISIQSENYTDITTYGFRLEFNKGLSNHSITYGIDFYNDGTENTDSMTQTVVGFGPPRPSTDDTPQVPNAKYSSLGFFLQDEIALMTKLSMILGVRFQTVTAKTKETPGLENEGLYESTDSTVVGTANLLYSVNDNLRLVFSVGRGFRSPNLIERFFNGMTPEGSGFQSRNTDLKAESSLNFDLGFKYRNRNLYLESTYFNNTIRDGIRVEATGNRINGVPEYQNTNIDKLRIYGFEFLGKYYFDFGLSCSFNFTSIKSDNLGNPEQPYTDTYATKYNVGIRYEPKNSIFWMGYDLRINGDQKDVQLGDNPIGDIIPGFSVHSVSAGVTLFKKSRFPQQLGIIFGNIGNTLYSEFSNASFFRPAPKRHIVVTWSASF